MKLRSIGAGHRLEQDAALAYLAAVAAGMPSGVTESFRTRATQAKYYSDALYYQRTGKTRKSGIKYAAKPGTSKHETGTALDLEWAAAQWLAAHPEFGWYRPDGTLALGEWWHFEFDPNKMKEDAMGVQEIETDTGWLVRRIAGSTNSASITDELRSIKAMLAADRDVDVVELGKVIAAELDIDGLVETTIREVLAELNLDVDEDAMAEKFLAGLHQRLES